MSRGRTADEHVGWSRVVADPQEAATALADPGDALDLRATGRPGGAWAALGFRELVPGGPGPVARELVRPVPVLLDGPAGTAALGRRLAAALRPGDLLVLSGPLGAGKTALAQGVGAGLGVRGTVTSPTFVLAREHRGPVPMVHVDAYRLRDSAGGAALDDLDLEVALEVGIVVVEWGDGLVEGLAASRLDVRLDRPAGAPESLRTALVSAAGPRWQVLGT